MAGGVVGDDLVGNFLLREFPSRECRALRTRAGFVTEDVKLFSGGLGYLMVRYGWPRPPFVLGFILGDLVETYLYISVTRYGIDWLYRPKVIIIFILAVCVALYPFLQKKNLLNKEVQV